GGENERRDGRGPQARGFHEFFSRFRMGSLLGDDAALSASTRVDATVARGALSGQWPAVRIRSRRAHPVTSAKMNSGLRSGYNVIGERLDKPRKVRLKGAEACRLLERGFV